MNPFIEFSLLFIGIVIAASFLSYGAEAFAERWGANFAGSVVLGLITTLPEYLFVIWACLKGRYEMAVGSAVGACSLLVTLGYGSVIVFSTTRLSRKPVREILLSKTTRIDALYLLVTAIVAFLLAWEKRGLDLKDAVILLGFFIAYIIHLSHTAYQFAQSFPKEHVHSGNVLKGTVAMAAGAALVFFLSNPFVDSMIALAHALGVSPVTVAVILGPIASEMPEKLTAYITVRRDAKLAEISICNFIGSAVNHNSLLLGTLPVIAWLNGRTGATGVLTPSFMLMTTLALFAAVSLSRRRLQLWQGIVFLALYGLVIAEAFQRSN